MAFLLGQPVTLTFLTYSDAARTTPADPTGVTLTVRRPDGVDEVFTLAAAEIAHPSVGTFQHDYAAPQAGHYEAYWQATGTVTTAEAQTFDVRAPFAQVISLDEVKARLNKTVTVDDDEIEDMLDAAVAEYEQLIGPVSGTVTEKHDGGSGIIVLRASNVSAVTAAAYSDGTTITVSDLDVDTATGIVRWGWNTAGAFLYGRRNVTITYTVGPLPANHREAIIADVAGYFETTQRGGGSLRPAFPGEGEYEAAYAATPTVLFPRIRGLAAQFPSIA